MNCEFGTWNSDIDASMLEIIATCDATDKTATGKADEYIYIEDLLQKNIEILTSNELIQYECSIAYFTQILIDGSRVNPEGDNAYREISASKMHDIVDYLSWISHASYVLATRIGQTIPVAAIGHDATPCLVRSSYNFCEKYSQCENFYRKDGVPDCRYHHYVHGLLKHDVDSIIAFLNHKIQNHATLSQSEYEELLLSIKTVCYVTRHMSKEILYIDNVTKNNSETFHRNNIFENNSRKIPFRRKQMSTTAISEAPISTDNQPTRRNSRRPKHNRTTHTKQENHHTLIKNRFSVLTTF